MSRLTSIFHAVEARHEADRKRRAREATKRGAIVAAVMAGVNLDPLPTVASLADRPVRVVLALSAIGASWNAVRPWIARAPTWATRLSVSTAATIGSATRATWTSAAAQASAS